MLKLLKIRKSNNPSAQVDGDYNVTSDGRLYYIAEFKDAENPFAQKRDKTISQQFDSQNNPVWKAGDPKEVKQYVGKVVPGDFITRKVAPYPVGDRTVDTYTAVVLPHENVETVFKNAGHPIVDTVTGEVKAKSTVSELNKVETL